MIGAACSYSIVNPLNLEAPSAPGEPYPDLARQWAGGSMGGVDILTAETEADVSAAEESWSHWLS